MSLLLDIGGIDGQMKSRVKATIKLVEDIQELKVWQFVARNHYEKWLT